MRVRVRVSESKMSGLPFFLVLFVLLVLSPVAPADYHKDSEDECVYTLYVKTGSVIKAGTDSKISIALGDASGRSVWVPNLRSWGIMEPNHDYWERGNLDILSGRGPCIGAPLCRLNVSSDGSGPHHGWFCEYMEVTSTGPHKDCSQTIFYVMQWLASDAPPYSLTAELDGCSFFRDGGGMGRVNGRFVVGGENADNNIIAQGHADA